MKYCSPLLVVENIETSRKFYEEVFGEKVIMDFGANITMSGGYSFQSRESWIQFIETAPENIVKCSNSFELYFEEENFDSFIAFLKDREIDYVHGVKEFPWGQRVIRFYDPDKHIIEVGESMDSVLLKFLEAGMSVEEIVERTMYPKEVVENFKADRCK